MDGSVIRPAIPRLQLLLVLFSSGVVEFLLAWLWVIALGAPNLGEIGWTSTNAPPERLPGDAGSASDHPCSSQPGSSGEV